jgi:hypothetical protein
MFIQIVQVLEGQPSWATSDSDLSQEWWKKCRNSWFFHVLTLHVLILPVVRMYCIFWWPDMQRSDTGQLSDRKWMLHSQRRRMWLWDICKSTRALWADWGVKIVYGRIWRLRIGWLHLSANKITKHLWIPTSPDCASFPARVRRQSRAISVFAISASFGHPVA